MQTLDFGVYCLSIRSDAGQQVVTTPDARGTCHAVTDPLRVLGHRAVVSQRVDRI
jgi:hypothetical protein